MKKLLSVLLALCLVLAAVPAAGIVVSADETFGDFTYNKTFSGVLEITGYKGSSAEITIPSQIGDEAVTAIGGNAFRNNTAITSVEIPSTVNTIDYNAFQGCEALRSITVPDSVTKLETYAFDGCSALKTVVIGSGLAKIDFGAFRNCISLEKVTLGANVTTIDTAFSGCTALSEIVWNDKIEIIGDRAFSDCTALYSRKCKNHRFLGFLRLHRP